MKKNLAFTFLLLSILFQTKAQNTEDQDSVKFYSSNEFKYSFGFTLGSGSLALRDKVISNFLYKGNYTPFGLHFQSKNRFTKTYYSLEFLNNPILKTETNKGFEYKGDLGEFFPSSTDGLDFSTLKTKNYSFNISQVYLFKKTEAKKIQVYLGYDLNSMSFYKKFIQFEYVNELRDRVMSAAIVANFERNFNKKHHLEYTFSTPILSYANRSLTNSESDPVTVSYSKFTIMKSVAGFDSKLTYRFQVAARFSLRASYSFHYLQVTFPRKEQWANNQLTIGTFFHF